VIRLDEIDPTGETRAALRKGLGCGFGLYLVGAAVLLGLLSWVALTLLAKLVRDPPYDPSLVPDLVRACVRARAAIPLAALPALACGLAATRAGKRTLLLVVLGVLLLLVPFAITLYCFIALIAPMYQYHPI
jgi:hypothetical protein